MKNMSNQEKNTYVRQHILSALLELMKTQDFANISIQTISIIITTAESNLKQNGCLPLSLGKHP